MHYKDYQHSCPGIQLNNFRHTNSPGLIDWLIRIIRTKYRGSLGLELKIQWILLLTMDKYYHHCSLILDS